MNDIYLLGGLITIAVCAYISCFISLYVINREIGKIEKKLKDICLIK